MTVVISSIGGRGLLADAAYERLRRAIFTGQIAPGARMSIPALAARLGVSRSPIRDAVLRLVHDGLAVREPGKGAALIVLDAPQLAAVYEVRATLEGLAARLAAAGHGGSSEAGVARLGEAVAAHADAVGAGDLEAAREADMAFHRITREIAANAQLTVFLEQIQDKIRLAMASTLVTPGPSLALAEHREIYRAIQAGDPDLAQARAVQHITRLRTALAAAPGGPPGQPGVATATDW